VVSRVVSPGPAAPLARTDKADNQGAERTAAESIGLDGKIQQADGNWINLPSSSVTAWR